MNNRNNAIYNVVLRKFVPRPGRDDVEDWYSGLSAKDRAKTRIGLDYLRQSREHWQKNKKYENIISGAGKGLGEIKFRYGRVRIRLIGFWGPGSRDFTVLTVEQKQTPKLPNSVWEKAQKRKQRVMDNQELAHVWQI